MNKVLENKSKENSCEYGGNYQLKQANSYRDRDSNHWKYRVRLARTLLEQYVFPKIKKKLKQDTIVVDVGCSIGTFAIEFSKLGYKCFGIDFDQSALDIAKQLSADENVTPVFACGDVSDWSNNFPPIDIAICFDIFEHLHDDELGSFLSSIRKQFADEGYLVFHTYPTEYDYIFYRRSFLNYPLIPFKKFSNKTFDKITKIYANVLDIFLIFLTGKSYKDRIKYSKHCNPTNIAKLKDILKRAGYKIIFMETSNLYKKKLITQEKFAKQPITHRNLYGVAVPRK